MANPADEIAKALEALWTKGGDDATRAVADDVIKGYGVDISPPVSPDVTAQWQDYMRSMAPDTPESGPTFRPTGDLADAPGTRAAETYNYWRAFDEGNPIMAEANDALAATDLIQNRRQRAAQRKAILSHEAQQLRLLGPSALGAAGTVLAGGALLGAGQAKAQDKGGDEVLWTPERVQKFLAKPRAQQDEILGDLTDEEFNELERAVEATKAPPSVVGDVGAKGLKPAQPFAVQPAPQPAPTYSAFDVPQPGPMSVGTAKRGWREAASDLGGIMSGYNPITNPGVGLPATQLLPAAKAALDVAGGLQEEYVSPVIRRGQVAFREATQGDMGDIPALLRANPVVMTTQAIRRGAEAIGPGAGHVAERATQLFYGPPETYRTKEDLAQRSLAATTNVFEPVAKAAIATNPVLKLAGDNPVVPVSAALESAVDEGAYLPLYLIDAPAKAGRVASAVVGGGLSELMDPREGSNALRGALFAGGIGLALEGIIKGSSKVYSAVQARAAKGIPNALPPQVSGPAVVLDPQAVVQKVQEIVEAAPEQAVAQAAQAATPVARQAPSAPAVKAVGEFRLPKELSGAKPRYAYGSKQFDLQFESDVDRALYIVAQKTPSKRDADYLKAVTDYLGITEEEARRLGLRLREQIKAQAKSAQPGLLVVAPSDVTPARKITSIKEPTLIVEDVKNGKIVKHAVEISHGGIKVEPTTKAHPGVPVVATDEASELARRRIHEPDQVARGGSLRVHKPDEVAPSGAKPSSVTDLNPHRQALMHKADELHAKLGYVSPDPTARDPKTGAVIFAPDEVPGLHQLPSQDTLVAWDNGSGKLSMQKLSALELQAKSLGHRNVVEIDTPQGVKLGLARMENPERAGEWLVLPFDPAEKMPNNIGELVRVNESQMRQAVDSAGKPTRLLKESLDSRLAQLEREAEEALDAARSPVVPEDLVPPNQPPPPQTLAGPGGMGNPPSAQAVGGPPQVPPSGPPGGGPPGGPPAGPPGVPPGGGPGVPPPAAMLPLPPEQRGWADGFVESIDSRIPKSLKDALISPTAKGSELDLTRAASAMKAGELQDIISARSDAALRKSLSPTYGNLSKADQAVVQMEISKFIKSRSTDLSNLERMYPEVVRDIRVQVEDLKARVASNQQQLQRLGELQPKQLDAPTGMGRFVDMVLSDEAYLMKTYLAKLLPAGDFSKFFKANQRLAQLTEAAAFQHFKKIYGGSEPDDVVRQRAREAIDTLVRDPESALSDPDYLGSMVGRGKLRSRAAGTWDAANRVLQAYKQLRPPQVAQRAQRYVEGKSDTLPQGVTPEDAKFLKAAREEYAELMPAWVRTALGELHDPFTLMPMSVARQEELIVKAKAREDLRSAGRILTRADWVAVGSPPGWRVTSENKSVWGKYASLGGEKYYVDPSAHDAIAYFAEDMALMKQLVERVRTSVDGNALGKSLLTAYDVFRATKTSLSLSAWWQNSFGLMRGMMFSGVMRPTDVLSRRGDSWRSFSDALRQWSDFAARPNELSTADKLSGADWIREGIKYGTIGSDWMSHEHRQVFRRLAQELAAGQTGAQLTVFDKMLNAAVRANKVVAGAYAIPDQVAKHAVWIAGLKRGGIDMTTGALVDRQAAVRFIFGNGLNQRKMSAQVLAKFPDDKLAEMVKSASAQRVAQSFAMPDRAGRLGQNLGAVATATAGMGANPFVRTAMEEMRILAQLPARALTQDGVGKGLMEYGLLAAGLASAMSLWRSANGVTAETERQSYMGMPQSQRMWAPGTFAFGRVDDEGRHGFVDMAKFFEPLKWLSGDPTGRPVATQLANSPAHLATRFFYNAAVGSAFGSDTPIANYAQTFASNLGLMEPRRAFAPKVTGPAAAAEPVLRYLAPGAVTGAASAYSSVQQGAPVADVMAQFLSGGLYKVGGTPEQGAKAETSVKKQLKREGPRELEKRDIGKSKGMFRSVDAEDVKESKQRRREFRQQSRGDR